jgi:hypothetical protein
VRKHWESISIEGYGEQVLWSAGIILKEGHWAEARAFTEDRLEQIRL